LLGEEKRSQGLLATLIGVLLFKQKIPGKQKENSVELPSIFFDDSDLY
jgi:hypothetical protein